jgi:hypothetical protein
VFIPTQSVIELMDEARSNSRIFVSVDTNTEQSVVMDRTTGLTLCCNVSDIIARNTAAH